MSILPLRVTSSFYIRQTQAHNFKNINNFVLRNVKEKTLPSTFQLQRRDYTLYNNRNINNVRYFI